MTIRKMDTRADMEALLVALAGKRLSWKKALGELIDNSLDAQATDIAIRARTGQDGYFSIEDNGHGTPTPSDLVALGRRRAQNPIAIGRYGVGAKFALLWIGGAGAELLVETAHEGTERHFAVTWPDVANDQCTLTEHPSPTKGTHIKLRPVDHRTPSEEQLDSLLDDLGFLYHPAIQAGVRITVGFGKRNAFRLSADSVPKLRPIPRARERVELSGGRSALIDVGVVEGDGHNPYPGISYIYDRRVIDPASKRGCSDASRDRLFGTVQLEGDWRLSTMKDEVRYADELYKKVQNLCEERGVFEAAKRAARIIETDALSLNVEMVLDDVYNRPRKERRDKGTKRGTVKKKGTDQKRTNLNKTQEGNGGIGRKPRGAFQFQLTPSDFNGRKAIVGEVDDLTIRLNTSLPAIDRAFKSGDQDTLLMLCFQLIALDDVCGSDGDRRRPWAIDRGQLETLDRDQAIQAVTAKLMASHTLQTKRAARDGN